MNKEELIQEILKYLPEITTQQFYVRSINSIMKLKMIQGNPNSLEDLDNLSEESLRIILNEMKDIVTMQVKERLRFAARRQQKGPGELL